MKKILSVTLCALILMCVIPFAAFAEDVVTFDTSMDFISSNQLGSGNRYVIPSGVTMTVPSDLTLYVPASADLVVEQGGKLVVYGSIITLPGGSVHISGNIVNANHISGQGTQVAEIRFPALTNVGLSGLVEVSYAVGNSGSPYEDVAGTLTYEGVADTGESVWCALNQYLFINAHITEPNTGYDKFDDSLMNVYINGVAIPYGQGAHHTLVSVAGDVTYSRWTSENDFLNSFNIYLPTGEGYTVYGREGEQSEDGNTVRLKYGQPFSFRVEIEPEYDMSLYEVYVYDGYGWTNLDTETLLRDIEPAQPDEYGYYYIPEVKGEHTIFVLGVVRNKAILVVGDVFDMLRNVFEMIQEFIRQIAEFFGMTFGGATP